MLFFLLLVQNLQAECQLKNLIPKTISTTQTKEIPTLIKKSKGCLTLVELWAGWCGTCKKIKPELYRILKNQSSVVHLSISADYTKGALKKYLQKNKYKESGIFWLESWTIDTLTNNFQLIGAHFQSAIPLIILIDSDGNILYEATEPADLSKLEAIIEKITKSQ
ncbi:MAG: hypothetical protein CL916_06470 [Deltaproteobacteria bacterium]|nr:hypothetical protein [Deltaproteobacteria bacterium]